MKKVLKRLARRLKGSPTRKPFQRLGDAARDHHDWALAAEFYAQHLQQSPNDFGIHVQHGHMLKEAGRLDDAASAYARAAKIKDGDADLMLSRGHLAKMRGRIGEALGFYHLSYSIDSNVHAQNELSFHKEMTPVAPVETSGEVDDAFDYKFYSELYLPPQPIIQKTALEHYEKSRSEHEAACKTAESTGEPAVNSEVGFRQNAPFPNLGALLAAYGMAPGRWLDFFSHKEYSMLEFERISGKLNRPQAIALFLKEGLPRLAPISLNRRFDLAFYAERHPHLAKSIPAEIYKSWLLHGLQHDEPGTAEDWLKAHNLSLMNYPRAFLWKRIAGKKEDNRWSALAKVANDANWRPDDIPLQTDGASEFLEALGVLRKMQGRTDLAIECYNRAEAFGDASPEILRLKADACHSQEKWTEANKYYEAYHRLGLMTLWSIVLAADSHSRIGDFEAAFEMLRKGRNRYEGEQPWISMLDVVVERFFQDASERAQTLYRADKREQGDVILASTVSRIKNIWAEFLSLPVRVKPKSPARIVVLANQGLKQCTYYRVDQKRYIADSTNFSVEIFDQSDTAGFMAALPGATAAIFYRIPAFPNTIKAVTSARSQEIPTYYEIDDLIFDSQHYPDPIESFQGQIDDNTYLGLIYGTPLFRSFMAECDYAIASTKALAEQMKEIVLERQAFVIPNGLDSRNIGLDHRLSRPASENQLVRIFYGSGTLAHNQDFNDFAGPGLIAILTENPGVELVIVGHLKLDSEFYPFQDRIRRVEVISDTETYWRLLSQCDINLAVLAPGLVSDCKSEIKWLEAAVLEIPSIVSDTATYRQLITDGVDGIIATSPQVWTNALRSLVADPAKRKQLGQNARQKALANYSLSNGAKALTDALAPALQDNSASATRKPRILIVNVFFPPQSIGGATRVVVNNIDDYIEAGAAERFDFAVATTDHDAPVAYQERIDSYRGLPVFRVATPAEHDLDWKPEDPRMGDWFESVLERFQPDMVHFHCIQRMTVSVMQRCTAAKIPYLVSVHDAWWLSDYQFLFDENGNVRTPGDELILGPRPGTKLETSLGRLAKLREGLEGATHILSVSQSFTDIYRASGFDRTITVSNGLPPFTTEPRRPSSSGRVRIGHIGNTSAHKGFDLVEAALKQSQFDNLELLALAHHRAEGETVEEIWGATPVTISGRVLQDQIGQLYAGLDVLLAPSAWPESYGLVTREANAAGLWVIASDRGAIGEDVREGIDGFVIDVSSPKDLQRTLGIINANSAKFLAPAPKFSDQRQAKHQAEDLLDIYASLFNAIELDTMRKL